VPREELDDRARKLAAILDDSVVAYAEHPYAEGTWQGHRAEIVPCYDLDDASKLQSAVDRTRFHTEYVDQHFDEAQRDEVRLLKAFLTASGVYGAKESVLGFSGYLCELLVLAHGTFEDVLAWAVQGFEHPVEPGPAGEEAFDEPLVAIDPVDPTRNAAAAVAPQALVRAREAAAAFRSSPAVSFFEAPDPARLSPTAAGALCEARGARVLAIGVDTPNTELADPVYAQLRRTVTLAAEQLEREQVPVAATAIHVDDEPPESAWALVEAPEAPLDEPLLHEGPPVPVDGHAESFRESWEANPDAVGDVFEDEGRLYVYRERDATTLTGIVEPHLRDANAGKVVDEALAEQAARVLEGSQALDGAPGPALAALLDRRRPWER
jgi:tRNA nucleotidyltransferase (CCA-adding enzyme)